MPPPINPPARAAPTYRCAWAGAGAPTAETASVATAASAIKVFLMASPFSLDKSELGIRQRIISVDHNLHIPFECSMNGPVIFSNESWLRRGAFATQNTGIETRNDDRCTDSHWNCG